MPQSTEIDLERGMTKSGCAIDRIMWKTSNGRDALYWELSEFSTGVVVDWRARGMSLVEGQAINPGIGCSLRTRHWLKDKPSTLGLVAPFGPNHWPATKPSTIAPTYWPETKPSTMKNLVDFTNYKLRRSQLLFLIWIKASSVWVTILTNPASTTANNS
jgi:hypothetical protein